MTYLFLAYTPFLLLATIFVILALMLWRWTKRNGSTSKSGAWVALIPALGAFGFVAFDFFAYVYPHRATKAALCQLSSGATSLDLPKSLQSLQIAEDLKTRCGYGCLIPVFTKYPSLEYVDIRNYTQSANERGGNVEGKATFQRYSVANRDSDKCDGFRKYIGSATNIVELRVRGDLDLCLASERVDKSDAQFLIEWSEKTILVGNNPLTTTTTAATDLTIPTLAVLHQAHSFIDNTSYASRFYFADWEAENDPFHCTGKHLILYP